MEVSELPKSEIENDPLKEVKQTDRKKMREILERIQSRKPAGIE